MFLNHFLELLLALQLASVLVRKRTEQLLADVMVLVVASSLLEVYLLWVNVNMLSAINALRIRLLLKLALVFLDVQIQSVTSLMPLQCVLTKLSD